MQIESFVFYSLIGVMLLMAAILLVSVIFYFRLNKKYGELLEEEDAIKRNLKQKSEEAFKLAAQEAKDLLNETDFFTNDLKKKFEEIVASLASQSVGELNKSIYTEMQKFSLNLKEEIINSQKMMRSTMEQEYKGVRSEVEAYKKAALARVDNKIMELLQVVTRDVLGKSLSQGEHKELVIKSLEEAKRENVF